jgi:hypothetical protein
MERPQMKATATRAAALAVLALALAGPAPAASAPPQAQQDELSTLLDRNLRSGGSWFTAEERAVIEQKCGYAPGAWDGFEANMSDGTFTCRDGRKVDDPEVRAVLRAVAPRIEARVEAVMARADIVAAIARVAGVAAAEALREVEARHRR